MASKLTIFAKILILLIFVAAGVNKFQETQKISGFIQYSMNNFEALLKDHGLVEQLPYKNLMNDNATNLCYFVGVVEVLCPILIFGACNCFAYVLFFMLLAFNTLVHNPFYKSDSFETNFTNLRMFFMNSMIMAGLLMVAGSSTVEKEVEIEIEESSSAQDVKPKNNASAHKKHNKRGNKTR